MSEWKTYKLGEIAEIIPGFAFKGQDFGSEGELVIKIKDITPPFVDLSNAEKVILNKYNLDKLKKYRLYKGQYVVAMTGATIGKIGKLTANNVVYINQRVAKILPKNLDSQFVYYSISGNNFQTFVLNNLDSQSAQGNISGTSLGRFEIQAPDLATQTEIASILSSLDDKIELNLQMNQTLEAMAQAIFKEWFVNFNFPGFDGELVDGLPKGWRKEPIDKSIDFLNGLALQKFPPQSEFEYLPVIKIRELRQGITESSDKASLEIPEQYVIYDGDVLFSWSGSLEVILWCDGKGALNQHLFKVSSKYFPKWFYYFWTKHYLPFYQSIAEGKATTMGHIQRRHLTETIINIPNYKIMELANSTISPLLEKLEENKIQIRNLTQIRDSLLPKLMTGKIEIQV